MGTDLRLGEREKTSTLKHSAMQSAMFLASALVDQRMIRPSPISILSERVGLEGEAPLVTEAMVS